MAAIHWTLNGSALFGGLQPIESSNTVPGSSDNTFIGTTNATVTSNGNVTVDSIGTGTNGDKLVITNVSTFEVVNESNAVGNFGTIVVDDGSIFQINSGGLQGGGTGAVQVKSASNNTNLLINGLVTLQCDVELGKSGGGQANNI